MAKAFEAANGVTVQAKYGPSGMLRDEIAGGAKAEVTWLLDLVAAHFDNVVIDLPHT